MMNKQKDIAIAFLKAIVTNKVEEAYDLYTSPDFIHHNSFYKGDRNSLLQGMLENNALFPDKNVTVKLAVAESPYVTLFSHVKITDKMDAAIVHIYRFHEDKIVEMWDIAQEVPKVSPNENGMF